VAAQSARETAVRVAAGAVAKKWLRERHGVEVRGYLSQLGPIPIPFRAGTTCTATRSSAQIPMRSRGSRTSWTELRKSGDSAGAKVTVVATGVPVGWGEPVDDKLDADIAYAMMGINAVKGVEIGAGFASVSRRRAPSTATR
jgi:chorismate synthase